MVASHHISEYAPARSSLATRRAGAVLWRHGMSGVKGRSGRPPRPSPNPPTLSPEDADLVHLHRWYKDCGYWRCRPKREDGTRSLLLLHRLIGERIVGRPLTRKDIIDHLDGDGYNNLRSNIRVTDHAGNSGNRAPDRTNVTGERGICLTGHKRPNKVYWYYHVYCMVRGVNHSGGRFKTLEEAIVARDDLWNKLGVVVTVMPVHKRPKKKLTGRFNRVPDPINP